MVTEPPGPKPSALSDEACRTADLLRALAASDVLVQEAVARRAGLNPTDLAALEVLLRDGPTTPGELAGRVGVTAGGAVTALIDRLQKAGLATRRRHPKDRRKVVVAARTAVALERIGPVPGRVGARWAEYLDTLTADEVAFAHELLTEAATINREVLAELDEVTPSAAASSSPRPAGAPRAPDGAGGARGGPPPIPR